MGRTELNRDDLRTVVEHFIRYSPAKPREAIDRLLKIELIRNNYTKSTVYAMFQRIKRVVNTGVKPNNLSQHIFDMVMELTGKKQAQPAEPLHVPEKVNIDELLAAYHKQLNTIVEAAINEIKENDERIKELQAENNEIMAIRDRLTANLKDQIMYWTTEKYKEKWLA